MAFVSSGWLHHPRRMEPRIRRVQPANSDSDFADISADIAHLEWDMVYTKSCFVPGLPDMVRSNVYLARIWSLLLATWCLYST